MRKLFSYLLIFLALSAFADDIPGYSGYVNDYAGVISEKDKASMEDVAKEVEEKTVSVTSRREGDLGSMSQNDLLAKLIDDIAKKVR